MSFKNNYFKCFSCNKSGSIIDLVMGLKGLEKPIEAVKAINQDFHLGLDLGGGYSITIESLQEQNEQKEDKAIISGFEKWVEQTYSTYAKLARYYFQNLKKHAPKTENEDFHPLYIEAINSVEYVNHILDTLMMGSDSQKLELYRNISI